MIDLILARLQQGHRTIGFPAGPPPALSDRFRGRPVIDTSKCPDDCRACADACPTGAIAIAAHSGGVGANPGAPATNAAAPQARLDLGKCLFCTDCIQACPKDAVSYSADYRLAVRRRGDLIVADETLKLAAALDEKSRRLFGRSLKLRQVSAGGCNACEADVNVLGTVGWDLGRFGVQFVASPRHADGLLVTGVVPENMRLALRKTYDAVPAPKIVIAVGACALSGGPYADHPEQHHGADSTVPVDLYIPGCPPHPLTILDGLLRLLGRIEDRLPA